jgi:hypothetical protein
MPRTWLIPVACLVLAGCPPDDDDTAGDDDDTTGDDDATDDDDSTGDDDGNALYGYLGEAVVLAGSSYDGHEDLYYIADSGAGDDLCRVRVALVSTTPRDDCADCEWAFAVTATDPQVVADSSVGCAGVGVDGDVIAGLAGERGYGFAREYFGHTDVLMIDQQGIWTAVNFAVWSEATGELNYDWEVGYQGYGPE